MSADLVSQRLFHKAGVMLIACLLMSMIIGGMTGPVSAAHARQVTAADLTVSFDEENASVSSGDPVGFTIQVANIGGSLAEGVTLTDTLPTSSGFTWYIGGADGAACSFEGGILSCNFHELPAGETRTVSITSPTTYDTCKAYPYLASITNTATVAGSYEYPDTNNSATAYSNVLCPLIYLYTAADASSVAAGEPAVYTVEVGNNGFGVAKTIYVDNTMPNSAGLAWSITSLTKPGDTNGDCTIDTSGTYPELLCSFDRLDAHQTIHITLSSQTSVESCGMLESAGYVTAANGGSVRSRPASIQVTCPSLDVFNSPFEDSIHAGDQIGFVIGVGNTHDFPAYNVTLTDTLPTNPGLNWEFPPQLSQCSIDSGVLTCFFEKIDAHITNSIGITSPTSSATCGTVENTASYSSPGNGSGSLSASITVLCPSLFTLQWTSNMRVEAGEPIDLTIETGNRGNSTASDVEVVYLLPGSPGLDWSIASITKPDDVNGSCAIDTSGASPQLECSFDQLGVSQEVDISLTSPTTYSSCGALTSSGYASASNVGRVEAQPVTINIIPGALPITMTADAGPFNAGEHIGFTIEVSNPYALPAYSVRIRDTVPSIPMEWLIDQQEHPECYLDSGTWICDIGTMAPGATYSVHIFAASSASTCGSVVENSATVSDSSGRSSSASDSLVVNCPDLTLTNIAASDTVNSMDPVRFDITVTNQGVGTALDVALSDTLPTFTDANWSISGADAGSCAITSGVLSCPFGDLASGAVKSIILTSPTPSAGFGKPICPIISHTANVTAYNEPAVLSAAATTSVLCPVVSAYITVENGSIAAGQPASFTATFDNYGEGIARNVVAEASLPINPGFHWSITEIIPASAADHCDFATDYHGDPEVLCSFDQMSPGQQVSVSYSARTTSNNCGVLLQSYAYITASNGGMMRKGKGAGISVICPSVVTAVEQSGYTRTYEWSVDKTVANNYANTIIDPVPFETTVNVSQTGFSDSAWLVEGKITATNPSAEIALSGVTITSEVDNGGTCTVSGGTDITIPAGSSVELDITCAYATQPEYSGSMIVSTTMAGEPPISGNPVPFTLSTLSTVNQSVDVTDSFNGVVEQINTSEIVASDDPDALTTWSKTYTREAPPPTNVCQDYTFTNEVSGTDQTASQKVRVCLPSLVTDSALCTFDVNTATPAKDFRLILTPDPTAPNTFKLNASNPGQFSYNIFYANPTGSTVSPTVSLSLPYPFVTQGAVPLKAYDSVSISSIDGKACLTPGVEIANNKAQVLGTADWEPGATFGSTRQVTIQLPDIPGNGFAYIKLHLDYDLKGSGGYTRGLNDSAVSTSITIPNPQLYTFTDNLQMTHTINSFNVFKKNPGIGGQAVRGSTMNPVSKVRMDIYNSSKKLLVTVYTDEDGWYMWAYKYTGKPATFTVKATAPGFSRTQEVVLKSNGFVEVDFLDLP